MTQPRQTHRPPLRPFMEAYTAVTGAAYTAKAGDRVIGVNRAGTVTVTLPTAQLRPGRIYTVKDESGAAATNNITVATEGAETIDGSATDVIDVDYESKSYYSDGTNWFILPVTPDTNTQLTLATTVSTQAHGDSAAPGSANTASKGDHKHAMPAAGGGAAQATQAALEAETNEDTYPPPDLLKFAPSANKAMVAITSAGAIVAGDYNIASIGDTGTGDRNIVIDVDFSDDKFCPVTTAKDDPNNITHCDHDNFAAGSFNLRLRETGTLADSASTTIIAGDQ
ncbi:MAG: hypothetical protein IH873_03855 [Chloroflexi bacterium]|nr:hypothetical protein [Chloroflexota bacterium]